MDEIYTFPLEEELPKVNFWFQCYLVQDPDAITGVIPVLEEIYQSYQCQLIE